MPPSVMSLPALTRDGQLSEVMRTPLSLTKLSANSWVVASIQRKPARLAVGFVERALAEIDLPGAP